MTITSELSDGETIRRPHWRRARLKNLVEISASSVDKKMYDGQLPVQLCNYVDVYYNDRITADLSFMPSTASLDEVRRFGIRAGDVLVTKDSESPEDIGISAAVEIDMPDLVSGYHLALLRPRPGADGRFVKWFFDSAEVKRELATRANGLTRYGIGLGELGDIPVHLPPLAEQRAIVEYLDRETGRIDALIAKQEQLRDLIADRRMASITRLVVGEDGDPSSVETGLEWMPRIRPGRRLIPLRYVAREPLAYGANQPAVYTEADWPRYLRITDFDADGSIRADTFRSLPPEVANDFLVKSGDMLFARSGATAGKAFLVDDSTAGSCFAGYLIRVRLKMEVCIPAYLRYFLSTRAYSRWRDGVLVQSTIENISADKYGSLVIPLPTIEEQRSIVDNLDEEVRMGTELTEKAVRAIALLRERRQTLISAAVTGQLDVRGR